MTKSLRHPVDARQRFPVPQVRFNAIMETMGDRVRRIRTAKGIGRPALAKAANMSYTSLADLENGYQVSTTKIHRLAEALGVTPEHLETGEMRQKHALSDLSAREAALVNSFRKASPDGKRAIEGAAAGVTTPSTAKRERGQKPLPHDNGDGAKNL